VLVAVLALSYLSQTWHEGRMVEGFRAEVAQSGADAAADSADFVRAVEDSKHKNHSLSRIESFVDLPAAKQQARKTQRFLSAGFASFFAADTPWARSIILSKYLLFFHPTAADLKCDFTTIATSADCTSPIDSIASTDRLARIPAAYTTDRDLVLNTVIQPDRSVDNQVYAVGGVYSLLKNTIKARAYIFGATSSTLSPVVLCLPRSDYATRLIMLLRPLYVRAGAHSALYKVDYSAPDTDGMSYDSAHGSSNATLSLVPVADPAIDAATLSIATVINDSVTSDSIRPPTTAEEKLTASNSARTFPVQAQPTRIPLVLYYTRYQSPNTGMSAGSESSVATTYLESRPGAVAQVKSASNVPVLTIQCGDALATTVTVTLGKGGVSVPSFGRGFVIACASFNTLTVACVDSARTFIKVTPLGDAPVSYTPANADSTPAALLGKLNPYNSQSVPNLADVALILGQLPADSGLLPGSSTTQSKGAQPNTNPGRPETDTLLGGESLLPGQALVSSDGRYRAVFQTDCNFVVFDTAGGLPVWTTGTQMKSMAAGLMQIDAIDGVIRLYSASVPRGKPYWISSSTPAARDQGPFSLKLNADGQLQVLGKYGAGPAWISGPGVTGFAMLATCEDASRSYSTLHGADIAKYPGMTAWAHYQQFGVINGWGWPGPAGPC
jgi:hypothetical protein